MRFNSARAGSALLIHRLTRVLSVLLVLMAPALASAAECIVPTNLDADEIVPWFVESGACDTQDFTNWLTENIDKYDWQPPKEEESLEDQIRQLERQAEIASNIDCDTLDLLIARGIGYTEEAIARASGSNQAYWTYWAGRAMQATKTLHDAHTNKGCP